MLQLGRPFTGRAFLIHPRLMASWPSSMSELAASFPFPYLLVAPLSVALLPVVQPLAVELLTKKQQRSLSKQPCSPKLILISQQRSKDLPLSLNEPRKKVSKRRSKHKRSAKNARKPTKRRLRQTNRRTRLLCRRSKMTLKRQKWKKRRPRRLQNKL